MGRGDEIQRKGRRKGRGESRKGTSSLWDRCGKERGKGLLNENGRTF